MIQSNIGPLKDKNDDEHVSEIPAQTDISEHSGGGQPHPKQHTATEAVSELPESTPESAKKPSVPVGLPKAGRPRGSKNKKYHEDETGIASRTRTRAQVSTTGINTIDIVPADKKYYGFWVAAD